MLERARESNIERVCTSQSVDCPLFELFEGDVGSGCICVEVETMGIFRVFVLRNRKLLLSVINDVSPLRIDSVEVLTQHFGR